LAFQPGQKAIACGAFVRSSFRLLKAPMGATASPNPAARNRAVLNARRWLATGEKQTSELAGFAHANGRATLCSPSTSAVTGTSAHPHARWPVGVSFFVNEPMARQSYMLKSGTKAKPSRVHVATNSTIHNMAWSPD